jgi:hypothetical protein
VDEASNRGPGRQVQGYFATTILVMLVLMCYRRSTYSMAMEADGEPDAIPVLLPHEGRA